MVPEAKESEGRDDDEKRCREEGEDGLLKEDCKVEYARKMRTEVVVGTHSSLASGVFDTLDYLYEPEAPPRTTTSI